MTSGAASIPRSKRWACRRPLCCARISSRRAAPSPTSECTGSKRICISNACGHRTSRSRPGSWITDTLALGSAAPGPSEHSAQRRFHYGWLSGAGSAAWPAEIGFEADSPLEGDGFEPSVPRERSLLLPRSELARRNRLGAAKFEHARDRNFADSPLEGDGFGPSVPRRDSVPGRDRPTVWS